MKGKVNFSFSTKVGWHRHNLKVFKSLSNMSASQSAPSAQAKAVKFCSEITFVPIHISQKNVFNFSDNKRRFDAFLSEVNSNIFNIPTDITEDTIDEAIKTTMMKHFEDAIPKGKKPKGVCIKSGYMLYCDHIRATVIKEHPGIKFQEIGTMLGSKWSELTPEQKAEWNEKSAAFKANGGVAPLQPEAAEAEESEVEAAPVVEAPPVAPAAKKAKTVASAAPSVAPVAAPVAPSVGDKKKKK